MTPEIKQKIETESEKYASKDFCNKSSWEYHNQYNSFKDGYSLASSEMEELKREVETLKAWKESAISVTPDMQAIAKVLNIKLGESIHDKILPEILEMQKEVERLKRLAEKGYAAIMATIQTNQQSINNGTRYDT